MASKFTKGTQPPFTCKASSSTGLVRTTGAVSRASKNTSNKNLYWAHERGLLSEERVRLYYQKQSFQFLEQRIRTPFAELDLLFQSPDGHLVVVEVKTANLTSFYNHRVTWKQKKRLLRAVEFLADRFECLVEIHWAFVTKEGEVTIISDISS